MRALESRNFLIGAALLREKVEDWEAHPFSLPFFRAFEGLEFQAPVTVFVGENGSGKSTLLEALAVAWGFNPEGGSRNARFSSRDTHSGLGACLRLSRSPRRAQDGFFLRAESFYNVATYVDEIGAQSSYGGRSLHLQSHGESFLALAMERFAGEGLYILDEPEAALSPMRQLALLARMHQLVEHQGSQFILATHSPLLMAYPGAQILGLTDGCLQSQRLEETEHFQVTRRFLNDPASMLKQLLEGA